MNPSASPQAQFLLHAAAAAHRAGHLFPDYAACEAALESGWGRSALAAEGNNLFGQKQAHPPLAGTETLLLPTREFLHGAWVEISAAWVKFADLEACFRERMALLRSLAGAWPNYRNALAAATGEQFIADVSRSWSTDPTRAAKVLAIYREHRALFAAPEPELEAAKPGGEAKPPSSAPASSPASSSSLRAG